MSEPLAYFITFTCYGYWLHGEERGSVDRNHNRPATPWVIQDGLRRERAAARMDQPAYQLEARQRQQVLSTFIDVCQHRGWRLWAAHVRSLHVHVVVTGGTTPEKVMNDLKAYASRALNETEPGEAGRKRWTRHGSTRYVNEAGHLERVIRYVLEGQGSPQAVFDGRDNRQP